jgi:catechol 2,3-dioxygenase-like lactoylglutathione lyase family enzyme
VASKKLAADSSPATTKPAVAAPDTSPLIVGVHHIRLPVSKVLESRDWYMDVFGFEPILDFEEAERLLGIVLEHPCGITLGLHWEPERAIALSGFSAVAFCVGGYDELKAWRDHLDLIGAPHSQMIESHIGWSIQVSDPDEIVVQLHTSGHPAADEA